MTLDDAFLWLNDRLGKEVVAAIWYVVDDFSTSVFEATGELRVQRESSLRDSHWHYELGDSGASFSLSEVVRPLEVTIEPFLTDSTRLTVRLDANTRLEVYERLDEDMTFQAVADQL